MQRRPLEPLPLDPDIFYTPFERLFMTFGQQVDKGHICAAPLIKETCYKDLLKRIGFDEMPIGAKGPKKFFVSLKSSRRAAPNGFFTIWRANY